MGALLGGAVRGRMQQRERKREGRWIGDNSAELAFCGTREGLFDARVRLRREFATLSQR